MVADWESHPILTRADIPEVKVVLVNRPEVGSYGGGSEAENAAALFDATGRIARRLPLRPAHVQVPFKV